MVLFDPNLIESELLNMVDDLPGGTSRLYAGSVGVNHVFVSGVEVVRNSEATGNLPGSIIRSGIDTDTVAVR
jgi:N-acyl-D-aspartate/D-glutamate deacylase